MNLTKREEHDYTTYASEVNKSCDDFKLSDLSAENFRCLIFVQGLVSSKDAVVRRRVLNKLENEQNITLQNLAEDCQRFIAMKRDSRDIEESGVSHIKKIYSKNKIRKSPSNKGQTEKYSEKPPGPCYGCGSLHWYSECYFRDKICNSCKKRGHKYTNCKQKWRKKSFVKVTKSNEPEIENIRKYVEVTINNRKIKLQLDSGSDLSILSLQTWKKIGKPTMMKTTKSARSVTGNKIKFEGELITNITLKGKTLKSKVYIMKNTNNLFGSDLIENFRLWDMPLSSFCKKVEDLTIESEKLKKELKETYPDVFSGGLGKCTKVVAKFETKPNQQPIFRKKRTFRTPL